MSRAKGKPGARPRGERPPGGTTADHCATRGRAGDAGDATVRTTAPVAQTNRITRIATVAAAAAALLALGVWLGVTFFGAGARERCLERYAYVNAAVACNGRPVISKRVYDDLREELTKNLRDRVASGAIGSYSVFFRDLANGPTFGIDEYAQFVPASLLKLPLVMAFLAEEDAHPGLLRQTVEYPGGADPPVANMPPDVTLQAGRSYAIETLLANTIRYSDNASYLLLRSIQRAQPDGDARLLQVYRELGIVNPQDPLDQTVTVRGYASLFRLLYNASYLDADLSELALRWLAQSEFKDGLVAGVPPGTTVAHKFGERSLEATDAAVGRRQFHDCGIVYYPKNPYLLCVMTRGDEFAPLIETVQQVSRRVYAEVAARAAKR
jgi:beta-lactamase class A